MRTFFFYISGVLRVLHSFPTRRSSDLARSSGSRPGRGGAASRRSRSLPAGQPDRKSTRLNSSHGSISYAVFCLKKKMRSNQVFGGQANGVPGLRVALGLGLDGTDTAQT